MAKAALELNRSEAIREAFTELPDAKAKEIVAYLKQKGIDVNEGLVYQVKKTMKKKKKPGRKPGAQIKAVPAPAPKIAAALSTNGKLGIGASITLVKSTAEKVGGWAALKEIVDALA